MSLLCSTSWNKLKIIKHLIENNNITKEQLTEFRELIPLMGAAQLTKR